MIDTFTGVALFEFSQTSKGFSMPRTDSPIMFGSLRCCQDLKVKHACDMSYHLFHFSLATSPPLLFSPFPKPGYHETDCDYCASCILERSTKEIEN